MRTWFVLCVVMFSVFVTPGRAISAELPKLMGYGPSGPVIPGKTDKDRWIVVSKNLEKLCTSQRDQVYKILGISSRTAENQDRANTWLFRITQNLSTNPVELRFFELRIEFNGDAVSCVKICSVQRAVGHSE